MDADVAVVGVGTMGSLVLWQLARRGIDALGFEQYAPGHDRGGVGGETRLFRMAYAEGAQYIPLLVRSRDLWRLLEAETGRSLFVQCGGLTIGDASQQYIADLLANAKAKDVPVQVLDQDEMLRRYPQHRLLSGEVAVSDPGAGLLRSDLAVLAATEAATAQGSQVVSYVPVDSIAPVRNGVEIHTQDRSWRVKEAVVAAGAWAGKFLPASWASLVEPRRIPLNWFAPDDVCRYRADHFPVFVRVTHGRFIYGGPTVDEATIKVGGAQPPRAVSDPTTLSRRHSTTEVSAASEMIEAFFSGLHSEPLRADAFTDLFTPDMHPLVGRLAASHRISLATGGSGRGFKFAPALAMAVADMITSNADTPFCFMSPGRTL